MACCSPRCMYCAGEMRSGRAHSVPSMRSLLLLLALCALCSGETTTKRQTNINTTKAASKGMAGTSGAAGLSSTPSKTMAKSASTTAGPALPRKIVAVSLNGTETAVSSAKVNITISKMNTTRKGITTDGDLGSSGQGHHDLSASSPGHNTSQHDSPSPGHNLTGPAHDPAPSFHESNQSLYELPTTSSDGLFSVKHEEHEENTTDPWDAGSKRYISLAKRGPFPFIVSIQYALEDSVEHHCTGTIVHSQWILTASRCASFARDFCGNLTVQVRSGSQDNSTLKVVKTVFHDQGTDSAGILGPYGLALLKLESPLEFSDNLKSISILPSGYPAEGPPVLLSWGAGETGEPHSTRFKPVRTDVCKSIGPQPQVPVEVACAVPVNTTVGRCYYDIGGPLVSGGDRPQLLGMLALWYVPCDNRKPALFMRLSEYANWMVNITGRETVTPATASTTPLPTTPSQPWLLPTTTNPPSSPSPPSSARRPTTVSSALAPGKNSISNSGSSETVDSSRAFSTAASSVDPGHAAAQSETVSIGSSICQRDTGALGLTFSMSYANVSSGSSISSSNVNASCIEGINLVQSLGWSVSSSDASSFDVKAVVQMHLDNISGLLRQPVLLYL